MRTGRGAETGRALIIDTDKVDFSPPRKAIRKRKLTEPRVNVVE